MLRAWMTPFVLAAVLAPAWAQVRPASIQGTVLKAGTAQVLPESAVELSPASGGTARFTTITDKDGVFRISDIPPGSYRLAATQNGYLRSEYGQRGPNGRGLVLALGSGEQLGDAKIELIETGAISGRILNRNGLPFPHVQVQALKYGYEDGRRVLKTVRSVISDDRGQYRLFWLPPGQYTLMAKPLRGNLSNRILDTVSGGTAMRVFGEPTGEAILSPDDEVSTPLFFPGTTSPQSASTIEVRPGANVRGMDLAFIPSPMHRVKGIVLGLPQTPSTQDALPPPTFLASIEPQGETLLEGQSAPRIMANVNPVTGAFELNGLFPGSYDLSASASVMTRRPDGALTQTRLRDRISISIVGTDVENVRLRLAPSWDIRGVLSVEGSTPEASAFRAARLLMRTRPDGPYAEIQGTAGTFLLREMRAGEFQVWVEALPPGHYVKSIRLGDRDVLADGLNIDRVPDIPLEVVISAKAAVVSGTVLDSRGAAARNIVVALVPDAPRRKRLDLYKSGFSDAAGRFRFTEIAPGDYKIFVWEDAEEGAWKNTEFIERYEESGKALHVEESANATIQVTLP